MSSSNQTSTLLWERLRGLFTPRSRSGPFDDEPQHRGRVIAVCLLTSVLLWSIFTLQETYTTVVDMPTEVQALPPGQALTSVPPRTVRAVVQGEGAPLLRFYYDPPTLPLDATTDEVDLETATPELPKNVRLESVTPRVVSLKKEPLVRRKVPIVLRAAIDTPPTHELLYPPRITPDSVMIAGARSIVESIDAWPTDRIVVEDLAESVVLPVPLSDTLAALVERSVEGVTMVAVSREFTEAIREIEVDVTGAPPGEPVTLVPSVVRVTFNVLLSDHDRALRAPDFFATVPYDEILADTTGRVRPRLHLPEGVMLRDVEMMPPTLRYYNVLIDE